VIQSIVGEQLDQLDLTAERLVGDEHGVD